LKRTLTEVLNFVMLGLVSFRFQEPRFWFMFKEPVDRTGMEANGDLRKKPKNY